MKTHFPFSILLVVLSGVADGESNTIEGRFGRVEVDTERPSVTALVLRRGDGSLEPQSLLSPRGLPWLRGMPDWGTEALTFAVDESGRRFESRNRTPESVENTADGIVLRGVVLTDGPQEPVAREDWTLRSEGDDFVWTVERTWLRDMTVTSTGTPALFFSTRPINNNPSTILPNSVATTFWIAPEKLRGWHNPFYRPAEFGFGYKLALENNVVVTEPGGWAVLKLFSAWPHECEPRFAVEGGHLYRRGHFGWLSEVGHRVVARGKANLQSRREGEDHAANRRRPGRGDRTPTGRAGRRSQRHRRRRCVVSTARSSMAAVSTIRSTTTSATNRTAGTTAARRG